MNTWILKWYPDKYKWDNYQDALLKTKNNEIYRQDWECNSNLKIGDRVFILKFGDEPNGIVASGYVSRESYKMFYGFKKNSGFVNIIFDKVLDFDIEKNLSLKDFYEIFPKFNLFNNGSEINITDFDKVVKKIQINLLNISGVSIAFKRYPASIALWLATAILSYERYGYNDTVNLNDLYFSIQAIKIKAESICKQKIDEGMLNKWLNENHDNYVYNYLLKNKEPSIKLISLNELWGLKDNIENFIKSDIFKTKVGIITARELMYFINNEYVSLLDKNSVNVKTYLENESIIVDSQNDEDLIQYNSNKRLNDEVILINVDKQKSFGVKAFSTVELKERAENNKSKVVTVKSLITKNYLRDSNVREYAKRLANGYCQLCGGKAPFNDKYGNPYLETHHIIWLSNGGKDTIENTVALCPNCHRKMHIVNADKDIEKLISVKSN